MSARGKICRGGCGAEVVLVKAANGGTFAVDAYPDPDGKVRVDVLGRDLVVLGASEPDSARTKRYQRHSCGPRQLNPRPEHRPQQLALGADA